ncbi:MAG: RloB domain-containing protein [Saprospiraceae bacterium]|nr:RloB domain-containing protein [Saprospiraceae bacterium]
MSNPCFEIWLILHLKDVQEFSQDERNEILKNAKYNKNKNYIDIVLGNLIQTGRGYNKIPNPLIFLHRDRIEKAIARAHALDTANEDYPSDIGSHVYRLVKKLLKTIEPDTLST